MEIKRDTTSAPIIKLAKTQVLDVAGELLFPIIQVVVSVTETFCKTLALKVGNDGHVYTWVLPSRTGLFLSVVMDRKQFNFTTLQQSFVIRLSTT